MAYSTLTATNQLIAGLRGVGISGDEVPRFAGGVASGLQNWIRSLKVLTADTGTAGLGQGSTSLAGVTYGVLYPNLLSAWKAQGLNGSTIPTLCSGLAAGLSPVFAGLTCQTNHPVVGVGAGVGSVTAPPALLGVQIFQQALNGVALTGQTVPQIAAALEQGLRVSVHSLVVTLPIVGTGSPTSTTGVGVGEVI